MDIIDIMLARAMTPQGQTDIYVNKANKAAATAEQAKQDAADAVATIEAAATTIETTQAAADDLLATAQETLETVQQAQINTLDTEDVDDEIKKFTLTYSRNTNNSDKYSTDLGYQYPDGSVGIFRDVIELKKSTGNSETAGMTQKAITDSLTSKADITYVNNKINISSSDSGKYVTVDSNGNLIAVSSITPTPIPDDSGTITIPETSFVTDTIGLDIDYEQRSFTRINQATTLSQGEDFNQFVMYGGRTRCNVADDGTINAFYGDQNYTEDGSNGQVMIYQPKFYYRRIIYKTTALDKGSAIRHESLLLSPIARTGFKLAPIFGDNLDYILLSAYNGSLSNSKLSSITGVTPMTGVKIAQAEQYANNRGQGWHIMNMAAVSMEQMLQTIEFGHFNGQSAIENGITTKPFYSKYPFLFITGSTSELGNGTGHATVNTVYVNNQRYVYDSADLRAISYRGFENPWGNLWNMIGGVNIVGNGEQGGGTISICNNFNYTQGVNNDNYIDVGFNLPNNRNWINAFGYGNENYDWIFIPVECNDTANSLIPIGDSIWITPNYNGNNMLVYGGAIGFKEECGMFYYSSEIAYDITSLDNYSARLMYIPVKDSIYTSNISKWQSHVGG